MFSISNSKLSELPKVSEGDMIVCNTCSDNHKAKPFGEGSGLLHIKCGESMYMVGIGGKLLSIWAKAEVNDG